MNEEAEEEPCCKPKADQITHGALGEIEDPGRFVLMHLG
jgi:hypothetical protein